MAKYKRVKPALEWLELSPLERAYFKPKKMTKEEEEELLETEDFFNQMLYKKELVDKARLQWALTHTSWQKKYDFIEMYGDKDYTGNFTGKLKNASVNYFRQNSRARGINNIGWYINAAYASGIDMEVLKELDAIAQVLDYSELQQLYHDLPPIIEYYIDKDTTKADEKEQEWTERIEKIIESYRMAIEIGDKIYHTNRTKRLNDILWEDDEDTRQW